MHDLSFDDAVNHVKSCSYSDTLFSFSMSTSNKLFLLHINIHLYKKNFDHLINFILHFPALPDIICITETRLKNSPLVNTSISEYNFVKANNLSLASGVEMYVIIKIAPKVNQGR